MESHYIGIEKQKIVVSVFIELQATIKELNTKVISAGYSQRDALISHVLSGYNKHEELIEKKERWEDLVSQHRVHDGLLKFLIPFRDMYGYFPEYEKMMSEFKDLIEYAIKKDEFEIVIILKKWYDKFT